MFRKPFLFPKYRQDRRDDPNSTGEEDDSVSTPIKPSAPESRPTSTAFSIADRSVKDPLGLKVVYRPPKERTVDIVFIHGLGGSSRYTWAKDHNLDNFWPLEFLPLEPGIRDARILTFGYNSKFKPGGGGSSSVSLLDFAKELLYDLKYATDDSSPDLEDLRLGQKPIIFLVHSMGGLIFKEAYMQGKDDPNYAAIIKAISSIIFLSTPHRGTNLAETLNRILRISLVGGPMQFISELASGSQTLQRLNESFRHVAEKLQIISFYETRPTPMIKGATKIMVLEKESSVLGYPGEISKPLDADHNEICKFNGPNDPRYITVRNALKNLVAKTHSSDEGDTVGCANSDGSNDLDRRRGSKRLLTRDEPRNQPSAAETAKTSLEDYLFSSESPNQDFNFFRDRWTAVTCEWILDNQAFTIWLEDQRMSPRVLWFQGNAAGGKSTMSSFIIDRLIRDGLHCYYFFFRFNDQKKRSIGTLLRSLAAQMANSIPAYAHKLLNVGSVTADLEAADFQSIWRWFFKDTLFAMGEGVRDPIYWVIDGLDEADTPASLIRLLADMNAQAIEIPLRILIVSRKTHEISSAFVRLGKRFDMETTWIEGSQQDLLAYVEQEMDFTEEGEYRDQVVAQLLKRAGGNFLWLHLAVQRINQCHTKLDVERALEALPSGMQELYDRMASSAQNQSKASDRVLGQSILGWATCARRSLSIDELRDALGGTSDEPEILDIHRTVEALGGGFVIVDNEGKIAMLHETARVYLTSSASHETTGRPCVVDPRQTHDLLFKRCMACLTQPSLRSLIHRDEPPALLNYAISSWYIHLFKGTCTDPNPEMLDVVVGFVRSPYILVWIYSAATQNALRLLVIASRYLSGVVLSLRGLQDESASLAHREAAEVLEGWAMDLTKIVGKFGKNLARDPDSIYRLIPPFCPSSSMVYQQFGKKESRTLQVSGMATPRWDDCLARFSFEPGAMATTVLNAGSRLVILTIVRRISTIVTYNDATFEEERRMKHAERVLMIQVNTLGTLLVSYGYKTTRIWDIMTGDCIKEANNTSTLPRPQAITFVNNDEILMSSEDHCLRSLSIHDASVEWELKSRIEEQGRVSEGAIANAPACSAISHDGRMVAYGYRGHPMTVWEIDPTVFFNEIMLDEKGAVDMLEMTSIKWHPLRQEIFGLSNVGMLFKWDPYYDRAELMTNSRAAKFDINRNGSLVVTGDGAGTVKVFAGADLSLLCQLHSQGNLASLSFSSDSRRLYDIRNQSGMVWEPNTLVRLAEKSEDPDGNTDLVIGDNKGFAKPSLYAEHAPAWVDGIVSLSRQPIGSLYCYGTADGVVKLGEIGRGDVGVVARSANYLPFEHLVWSEDGRLIALSDLGGRLLFKRVTRASTDWSIQHENEIIIPPAQGHITQLVFHPSGNRLLSTTPTTLHCIDLKTWEVNTKPCPVDFEPGIKWACHPTTPEHILGFSRTRVRIMSWTTLEDLSVRTYEPPRTLAKHLEPAPPTSPGHLVRNNSQKADGTRIGRLISAKESPQILLETHHIASSGESTREVLVFETVDITPIPDKAAARLSYTTLPEHVSSRIREPLAFLPRRRLAYLDMDRWICTYRLSGGPTLGAARRPGAVSSASLPSSRSANQEPSRRLPNRSVSVQNSGATGKRVSVVIARRHGSESVASDHGSGVERHYFLPGDWAMANEAHLCTMTPDGTLLCPQNGGIASVQSATLRK